MKSLLAKLARHLHEPPIEQLALAARTSVRVGGAAELFVRPRDAEELRVVLQACAEAAVEVTMLGGGANSLVADAGIGGVTARVPAGTEEQTLDDEGGTFTLSAGAPIMRVIQLMREHQLVGAEFLAGIPGTLGGATAMNAGTKHGEAQQVLEAVELVSAAGVTWVPRDQLSFSYRHVALDSGTFVSRVRVRLRRGTDEEVRASRAAMSADLAYRRRTQPLSLPSSGSVFRNPPGDHAGRLIEASGLKGRREGGAQVSELHANFIVNRGGACANDVRTLLELARAEVRGRFGVELTPEVRFLGRWESWQA